jgi:DMSO/TMAO reductase YedYZ molybdopterin-dependent catalytic subunit
MARQHHDGMDMPSALHPQTIMAFRLGDEILPIKYGYRFKRRLPIKLGVQER